MNEQFSHLGVIFSNHGGPQQLFPVGPLIDETVEGSQGKSIKTLAHSFPVIEIALKRANVETIQKRD